MFQKSKVSVPILIAEDDEEDRMLVEEAMEESKLSNPLFFVHDGQEVMDFLHNKGKYEDKIKYPLPGLILLDLNMPKKDGREVLEEIRQDIKLRGIPIIILTTSKAEEDVIKTYNLGVNSYITKPVTFDALVEIVRSLGRYWFEIVTIPYNEENSPSGSIG